MLPRPLTFPLFPYTTLFRSRFLKAYSEGVHRLHTDPVLSRRAIQRFTRVTDARTVDAVYQYALDCVEKIPYNTREDQKSTRLNSSHLVISYAVFSLKKKNLE